MTPRTITLSDSDAARFSKFLRRDSATGCLLWVGGKTSRGYGQFHQGTRKKRRGLLAHRVAFLLAGGILTPGKPCVLHDCPSGDNKLCCEFTHLWAGTKRENIIDASRKGQLRKSPYAFGARRRPESGRFQSQLRFGGTVLTFGTYDTAEEASAVALAQRKLLRGW